MDFKAYFTKGNGKRRAVDRLSEQRKVSDGLAQRLAGLATELADTRLEVELLTNEKLILAAENATLVEQAKAANTRVAELEGQLASERGRVTEVAHAASTLVDQVEHARRVQRDMAKVLHVQAVSAGASDPEETVAITTIPDPHDLREIIGEGLPPKPRHRPHKKVANPDGTWTTAENAIPGWAVKAGLATQKSNKVIDGETGNTITMPAVLPHWER